MESAVSHCIAPDVSGLIKLRHECGCCLGYMVLYVPLSAGLPLEVVNNSCTTTTTQFIASKR